MSVTLLYKCPCCGGDITFEPNVQKMKCSYCDTEFDIDTLKQYEEELNNKRTSSEDWDETEKDRWSEDEDSHIKVYVCQSCAGEIAAEETTAASVCPFCGNPVIMTGSLSGKFKPDIVIPFKLDKKAAQEGFKKHLCGKRLLPKVFRSESKISEIKGIYVPFWLFDADVEADASFKGKKVHVWSDSHYDYTETSYYHIARSGKMSFSGVPVDGSLKMDDALMESIEPFDLSQGVDFRTAYLSGYLADKYDVSSEESRERAVQRMRQSAEDALSGTVYGYSSLKRESLEANISRGKAKYALLPVWIMNVTWKDKKYMFAMNGQTGKFVGDLPLDRGAFARWFFGVFALGTAVSGALIALVSTVL